jgi:hypothetical protein
VETWTFSSGYFYYRRLDRYLNPVLQALPSTGGYTLKVTNAARPSEYAQITGLTWNGAASYSNPIDVKYRVTIRTTWTNLDYYSTTNTNDRSYLRGSVSSWLNIPSTW